MTKPQRAIATSITHEEVNSLPLNSFSGKVVLIKEPEKLATVFEEVQQHAVAGFDTETRPSFKRGQLYQVSLLQIAIPDKVYLIRLNKTGITDEIVRFLQVPTMIKSGVGVHDDIRALQKLKRFAPDGFVDLAVLAKKAGLQVESVKKLAALLLGFRISKSSQTSNWDADVLTQKQIEYAATDAWVCLELYRKLSTMVLS
ncbi:MAG: 3'-5' exonuclease domain-containing protein 2 [Bacteroidia bacterium]|nr:3'-5' exonuclease domain-containing protein 2 [Bacteroidia bacterium]